MIVAENMAGSSTRTDQEIYSEYLSYFRDVLDTMSQRWLATEYAIGFPCTGSDWVLRHISPTTPEFSVPDAALNPREMLSEHFRLVQGFPAATVEACSLTGDVESTYRRKRLAESLLIGWLADALKHEEILVVLRLQGLTDAASRISYLQLVASDDPNEAPIDLESLRDLARFLIAERQLRPPRIAVSNDGMMQIEWRFEDSGILAMKFLTNGQIQFVGIAGEAKGEFKRENISGTYQRDDMMRALRPFLAGLHSV